MRRVILSLVAILCVVCLSTAAAKPKIVYTNAQELTFCGKMLPTTNPYHRVETAEYPELTSFEGQLLRYCAGEFILFETNATQIWVKPNYGNHHISVATAPTAGYGFSIYIQKDGQWLWAGTSANKDNLDTYGNNTVNKPLRLVANMNTQTKKCMIYLPLYGELNSLEIGVNEGATITKMENPFRHRIAIWGSSFTHGAATSGGGMTYPTFLMRSTGLYLCSFAMDGNSKLQAVMGTILGKTMADAYIFDSFSNPSIEEIRDRIRPFLNNLRSLNPKAPIIFLRTIYRESSNFDTKSRKWEADRTEYVDNLMKDICKEYSDVYYVDVPDQTGTDHNTSADGTHPFSWGYYRWAKAIEPEVVRILGLYGIK